MSRTEERFPAVLPVLPAATRAHLRAISGYAQAVDDLGDGPPAALDRLAREVDALCAGRPVQHPVLRALAPTVAACQLPHGPLRRLIEAKRVERGITRYHTFSDLAEHCTLSANPVGELVLHVFGQATEQRVALADRIGTALRLVGHLRNLPDDHRRGRVYLPVDDMARFGVADGDLARPSAPPALRALVALTAQRAGAWLESGAPLMSSMRGWGRLAVGGYLAGGRAALVTLARAGYDPQAGPRTTSRGLVLAQYLTATVRTAG